MNEVVKGARMSRQPDRLDRRAERHASTKREILDSAWRLSDERGLTGWGLRDVAGLVGMRAPSLYVYFESKSALYDAMFADGYRAMLDRVEATEVDPDPVTMVHRAAQVFFDFAIEQPARYLLLFLRPIPGFEPSPESYKLAESSLGALSEILAAAGAGGPGDVDLFTALMTGLASQQVSNDPHGRRWAQLVGRSVDMFLYALSNSRSTGAARTPAPMSRSSTDPAG
jgi:AcrR family transcriptional regulator